MVHLCLIVSIIHYQKRFKKLLILSEVKILFRSSYFGSNLKKKINKNVIEYKIFFITIYLNKNNKSLEYNLVIINHNNTLYPKQRKHFEIVYHK